MLPITDLFSRLDTVSVSLDHFFLRHHPIQCFYFVGRAAITRSGRPVFFPTKMESPFAARKTGAGSYFQILLGGVTRAGAAKAAGYEMPINARPTALFCAR